MWSVTVKTAIPVTEPARWNGEWDFVARAITVPLCGDLATAVQQPFPCQFLWLFSSCFRTSLIRCCYSHFPDEKDRLRDVLSLAQVHPTGKGESLASVLPRASDSKSTLLFNVVCWGVRSMSRDLNFVDTCRLSVGAPTRPGGWWEGHGGGAGRKQFTTKWNEGI